MMQPEVVICSMPSPSSENSRKENATMTMSVFRTSLLPGAVLLILASCASTELTSVWRDPSYQDHPHKIMVIGMLPSPASKRMFEDEMVRQFRERGTDAVASYALFPEDPAPDRTAIEQEMRAMGADTVLISRLMDKKTVTSYVPPPPASPRPMYGAPPGYYGSQWYGYYSYNTGSVRQDEYAVVQTNIYDLKSEKLVWSAASQTWLNDNSRSTIASFIDVIMKKLSADSVIASGKGK